MQFIRKLSMMVVLVTMMGMVGCALQDTGAKADKRLMQIINYLEQKDTQALKALFSSKVRNESVELDSQIEYLMNFYQGKMVNDHTIDTSGRGVKTNRKRESGVSTEEILAQYIVETDADRYFIFFIDKTINSGDRSEVGLYSLQILKASDSLDNIFDWGNDIRYPGIYVPA